MPQPSHNPQRCEIGTWAKHLFILPLFFEAPLPFGQPNRNCRLIRRKARRQALVSQSCPPYSVLFFSETHQNKRLRRKWRVPHPLHPPYNAQFIFIGRQLLFSFVPAFPRVI